jgi:hypothetical protein
MATANLSWTPVDDGFSLSQDVEYKAMDDVGWTLHSVVSASTNTAKITGLLDNVVYQIRITNHCPEALTGLSTMAEVISLTCPSVSIDESHTTVAFSFDHLGGDVSSYVVDLLSASNDVLNTQTFSSPGAVVSSTFTGLDLSTLYRIRVAPRAQGSLTLHTLVCIAVSFTTDSCEPPTDVSAEMS